jgi:hypothetical protein
MPITVAPLLREQPECKQASAESTAPDSGVESIGFWRAAISPAHGRERFDVGKPASTQSRGLPRSGRRLCWRKVLNESRRNVRGSG